MYWLVLACTAVACSIVAGWLQNRRTRSMLAHLPSYKSMPLLGSIQEFIGGRKPLFNHLCEVSERMEETNLPFVMWAGQHCVVFVSDPDDVRTITNSCVEKPYFYKFARMWLGDGLFTASASTWKRNIKKLAGSFTTTVVDNYQVVFNAQAMKLVENLKTELNGKPFDLLHKYLAFTTLEAICRTVLGDSDVDNIVTKEYYDAFNRYLHLVLRRVFNLPLHLDVLYRLTRAFQEMKQCIYIMHNLSLSIIRKRRQERKEIKTEEKKDENENNKRTFKAYVDILLDMKEVDPSLTEHQIRSELDTIIIAGQETVATSLNYVFLMLGCRQDVQRKLYDEIKDIFGDDRRPVTKEDLARMVYCEAVICETLRMFPPFPGVLRLTDRDVPLKSCTIPKGASCFINIWGANRSQRVWGPDAQQYSPERWLSPNPGSYALMTFSVGKRCCIGKRYAMALMKTTLAHCLMDMQFVSDAHNMKLKIDLALRPVRGHLLEVRPRDPK